MTVTIRKTFIIVSSEAKLQKKKMEKVNYDAKFANIYNT